MKKNFLDPYEQDKLHKIGTCLLDKTEYIYRNIDDLDCQVWASDLEPCLHFVKRHNIQVHPSVPVLDKDG